MQVETLEQIAERFGWSDERLAQARARAAESRPSNVSDSDRARADALRLGQPDTSSTRRSFLTRCPLPIGER